MKTKKICPRYPKKRREQRIQRWDRVEFLVISMQNKKPVFYKRKKQSKTIFPVIL